MKKLFFLLLLGLLVFPQLTVGQTEAAETETTFHARVLEIMDKKTVSRDDGSDLVQQKLKLVGLNGDWKNKEFIFDGTQYEVISSPQYKVGDKVVVNYSKDSEGNDVFYVIDYVRQGNLYLIALIFAIIVILVGRLKGVRALIVLFLTFFIILKFIIPQIMNGASPLLISIIGSSIILLLAVYITEGLKRTSTITVASIFIALVITGVLSVWFTALTKLTGFASEEAIYLTGLAGGTLNLRGLLLAGIVIGALGVLDDVVISQVTMVRELKQANPQMSKIQVYRQAMKVGVSHMSAMVNTLFLAYAGASLPLLILFSVKEPPFLAFTQVLNNG